ncbi:ABC transporter substrate-binding protein [Paenisporosarcina sp. TG-14]|uniref:ABC transporter substrate-binding protein n=1 Tax=Paenisporosarcina sp. TG-14 TaxID=1231057 RepID=UPI0003065794|nr:ABC transporter substrate-binding protein [Paenisporosarcina sp. TG-14]
MKKRKVALSILAASILLFLTACGQPSMQAAVDKPVIKIGYLPITHAGPLYMDEHMEEGKYGEYELEMVKFNSWPDLMDALNTGRIDGASVLVELAMKAKEKGIDLKAVALGHKDGNVVISSKDIKSAKDLKGKTFAIPHTYSSHNILLYEMLKNEGLSLEDVNIVEMAPPEMPAALSEQRISGYVVAEPFGALAVKNNIGKVLHHSDAIWADSYCCVLVLRQDFMDLQPKATQSLVTQYVESGEHAEKKDEAVYEAFSQYMKVEREVLELSLGWISFENLRIEETEYNTLRDFVLEMELMEIPPVFEDFVDNTYIDEAM